MMDTFTLADIAARQQNTGRLYHEFLRVPAMSMGLYVLPAGGTDPQQSHNEDEVYQVLSGRAILHVAGKDHAVGSGSIVYVPALAEHRFHSITEELSVLVFFAPAETKPKSS